MNIILEQREDIFNNNNTAQEQFNIFLNKTHKSTNIIDIEESLFGDLDLSLLTTNGFIKVDTIRFNKGKITSLKNIPPNVKEIQISDNLLIEIEELPKNLEILNVENNYLSKLDFKDVDQLLILNISHNNFERLDNLPSTITELKCNHNKITYINLFEMNDLKLLNANNNKISIIDNLPNGIIKLLLDNNPNIQYHNTESIPNVSDDKSVQSNYLNTLNDYYKIKSDYERKLLQKKRNIYKKAPNRKTGKILAANIKMPCIYCKRNVSTIFTTKSRHLKAYCGDSINPCELKIDIFCGEYFSALDEIEAFASTKRLKREEIINLKLDSLFDYVNKEKTSEAFKEKMDNYSVESEVYNELFDKYNSIHGLDENTEKFELFKENLKQIKEKKELILKLKEEYKETKNKVLLKDAIDIHVNEIKPLIENNNFLEFEKIYMDRFELNKIKVSYTNLEDLYGDDPRVISFKTLPSVNKINQKKEDNITNDDDDYSPIINRL